MKRMSFGKKNTNNTSSINDGGIVCSASSDGPVPLVSCAQVSEAGEEIRISSGTKRFRSVIQSDNENDSVEDDNNSSFTSSSTTNSAAISKVNIFVVSIMSLVSWLLKFYIVLNNHFHSYQILDLVVMSAIIPILLETSIWIALGLSIIPLRGAPYSWRFVVIHRSCESIPFPYYDWKEKLGWKMYYLE